MGGIQVALERSVWQIPVSMVLEYLVVKPINARKYRTVYYKVGKGKVHPRTGHEGPEGE